MQSCVISIFARIPQKIHGMWELSGGTTRLYFHQKEIIKAINLPFLNEFILQRIRPILSGCGITVICSDWQLLVIWCHWYLKEQKLAQHHSNREIILHVRTHESFVRKHIQSECKVSLTLILKHEFSVAWFPTNWWHHTIYGVVTAELNFYFADARYDVFSSHGNFQNCIGVDNGCRCVPACCIAASQRCSEYEVSACFGCFACGVQESNMVTVHTTEEGLGNSDGHILAVALHINAWSWLKTKMA